MVGLLAAVGTTMSSLVAFTHGNLVWLAIVDASAATGVAAYLALPDKKNPTKHTSSFASHTGRYVAGGLAAGQPMRR
jgi:hypothetical protein